MQVIMNKQTIQAMLAYNSKRITQLEEEFTYLRSIIQLYWDASNPMNNSVDSVTAFSCLNISKDQLRKVKKELKVLRAAQQAMKQATLF